MKHVWLILLTLGTLSPAVADCTPSTTSPELSVLDTLYVDYDDCAMACSFSVWIYQESNGIPGLQRQDSVRDNTCGGTIAPDTLIF